MEGERKSRLTIEDLLRLKRAERPAPEFWSRFERELREKQLAAILEKRPWWRTFPRVALFATRHQVGLGVSAALACACVLSFHEYRGSAPARPSAAPEENLAAAAVPAGAAQAFAVPRRNEAEAVAEASARPVAAESLSRLESLARLQAGEAAPAAHLVFLAPGSVNGAIVRTEAQPEAAPAVEANFAPVSWTPLGHNLTAADLPASFGDRVSPAQMEPAVEPLAAMPAPAEARRFRWLAAALPASATQADVPVRTSDRLVSSLSDDRLNESVSRYGVEGNAVFIRF